MPNRIDSAASKAMGAAKSVKARLEGLVGVFRLLSQQHGEASALIKSAKAAPARRAELWPKIRADLMSHEQAELSDLYPVLREYPAMLEIADHHDAEAAELSALIGRIHLLDPMSETWGQLFDELAGKVQHHVAEEENEIFPKAQEAMGEARARELEPKLLATQKQIQRTV